MKISNTILKSFRDDLCKDQREIRILFDKTHTSQTGLILRKYSSSLQEFENEIDVINHFQNDELKNIPAIIGSGSDELGTYLDIEYYNGIRVFNVLAYIREFQNTSAVYSETLSLFEEQLLGKCLRNQKKIQKSLYRWSISGSNIQPYPNRKLFIVVDMLLELFGLELNQQEIKQELVYIADEFEKIVKVPFRDSTTKNMVIYCPELYLERFLSDGGDSLTADELRKEFFFKMVEDGSFTKLLDCPIIDFDFSSCEYLTSLYDDPIGFSCHEITFKRIPKAEDLIWFDNSKLDYRDIALSFIIRYLRFGGRKMTYHIIHPHAYSYRFRYDNEFFYFDQLESIIRHFWPDSINVIPEFINLIRKITTLSNSKVFDEEDKFELQYPDCNRKFYLDIFPY